MVKIVWSSKAVSDKKSIFEYWNLRNHSTIYSQKLDEMFDKKLNQITDNPLSGIETDIENIRAVLVEEYYIYYSIKANNVRILRIWDAIQNPETFVP